MDKEKRLESRFSLMALSSLLIHLSHFQKDLNLWVKSLMISCLLGSDYALAAFNQSLQLFCSSHPIILC